MFNNAITVTQRTVVLPAGSSTLIAPAVPIGRNYLTLQNRGANDAELNFGAAAVSGSGFIVYAGGGFGFANGEGVAANAIYGISTLGTTIVVLEG